MDRTLHNRLVALVLKVPGIEYFGTRSDLLTGIPNLQSLQRDHSNTYTDISRLIGQLAKIQLLDGKWAILIFIENVILRVAGTMIGEQLEALCKEIEASYQQAEQGSSPPDLVQSSPQSLTTRSPGNEQDTAAGREAWGAGFPHGYAVIVGISTYLDPRLQLSEAIVKDVMDMHTTLRAADYCGYVHDHVHLRYDAHATANTIRDDLRWLAEATVADEKATALFYFSGHGERVAIDGQSSHYLIPYDCNLDNLESSAISGAELAQLLHTIRAPRLLILLDSCYAGGFDEIKGIGTRQGIFQHGSAQEEQAYYEQLAEGEGRVIITSSRSTEASRASSAMNNSLFTRYMIEGLRGKAHTQGDGLIRVYDLYNFIAAQVTKHHLQRPVMTTHHAENFPVALSRGGQQVQAITQQPA